MLFVRVLATLVTTQADNNQTYSVLFRLYQSPKASRFDEDDKYVSPVQWLNEEMEHPKTPKLASARKNILYKMGLIESELT